MKIAALSLTVLASLPAQAPQSTTPDAAAVDFERDVLPILADRCFACHGPDAATREADLRLDRRDDAIAPRGDRPPAIVPGDPTASLLIARVFAPADGDVMPPRDSNLTLTDRERATLHRWIADGAPWRRHWAFEPPARPRVPADAAHPIDAFVRARLRADGIAPSPEATKSELIRRVTFALTGLPPTLDEIDAFLTDSSGRAYERVVDRLLASPAYGEHLARPWLDAARYADTNGYQGDRTRTMWPWRDWVIDAFNSNLPFDRFTVEQLAGDLLPDATTAQHVATGFHRNHMLNGEGGRIAEESRVDYVVDRVNTTGTVWLGLTVSCAQCHDHKFDPISQRDYYRIYAYFNSIDETGAVDAGGNARPVLRVPTAEQIATIAALEDERDRLATELAEARERAPDPAAFAAWLVDAAPADPMWTPLAPSALTTREPVTTEPLADGSTLISGANPASNDYTFVTALQDGGRVTGIRLDALPHASMTNGYLARSNSGNFVLTEVRVRVTSPAEDGDGRELTIASASADFEQNGFPIERAFDGDDATGWAVHGDRAFGPHAAVFRFADAFDARPGTKLTIRLEHRSRHRAHNLGRFRLAVADAPAPTLDGAVGAPPAVAAALATPAADRTAQANATLLAYYRTTQPVDAEATAALDAVHERLSAVRDSVVSTMVLRERAEPRVTNVLIRGRYDAPDTREALTPGVPGEIGGPADAGADRLGLARWLVAPDHPLTARVTVNRFWQQLFGRGLVATVEDFGVQGSKPSHPQLLDWLATEFVASGWDVKALHRLLVTSRTFRQSSHATAATRERDPTNAMLARGPRYRLSSFAIRDQALALGGLLVNRIGGPSVNPYQPAGVWKDATFGTIAFRQDHGDALYRRSLYTFWRRIVGPTGLFDSAARQVCEVRREPTNTPLHALVTLNDVTYVEAARGFATRVLKACRTDDERVTRAFRLATARSPNPDERRVLQRALTTFRATYAADATAADALVAVGESARDPSLDVAELATWTQLCHLILNLDEVLTTS